MIIEYTRRTNGFDPKILYRNPDFYTHPERRASLVILDGQFNAIQADYESLGIAVQLKGIPNGTSQAEKSSFAEQVGSNEVAGTSAPGTSPQKVTRRRRKELIHDADR